MLRAVLHLFHRPAIRLGIMDDARGLCRNPRFASFMVQCNQKTLDTHFHDNLVRARRLLRQVMVLALIGGGAWVIVESARALVTF